MSNAIRFVQPFVAEALAACTVGTWAYDVAADNFRFDQTMGTLFGLSACDGLRGIPIERVAAGIHPADRDRARSRRNELLTHGGLFVLEYRTMPAPGVERSIMARGHYDRDDSGKVVRGRGIVIDLSDSKREGYAEGDAFFLDIVQAQTETPVERAARFAIETSHAIDDLGAAMPLGLRRAMDMLLMELGRRLSRGG